MDIHLGPLGQEGSRSVRGTEAWKFAWPWVEAGTYSKTGNTGRGAGLGKGEVLL